MQRHRYKNAVGVAGHGLSPPMHRRRHAPDATPPQLLKFHDVDTAEARMMTHDEELP